MNPNLMHHIAQDRRADLLREAEEYRRAGLTARPTVLIRISARIPRFPTGSRRRRPRVVVQSTPGRMPLQKINLLKGARLRRNPRAPLSIQSALVSTLEAADADRYQLFNEDDAENFRQTSRSA
jgi:hypothetical protein